MATYVQAQGSDAWHWCRNCSGYPVNPAKRTEQRPEQDLCIECKSKEAVGNCSA